MRQRQASARKTKESTLSGQVEVTSQTLINNLRSIAQPQGKKGLWLRHLSDKRLTEVYHRLKLGQSSYQIAKHAQTDWGIMQKSKTNSLARAVRLFRDKTIGLIKVEANVAPDTDPERADKARQYRRRLQKISEKLDAVSELANLIFTQKERMEWLRGLEKTDSWFVKSTEKAIENYRNTLDTYFKYAIQLGILDAKPPELHLKIKHRFDGLLQHAIQGDGSSMIAAADKFLELAEKNALTMHLGDDGTYHEMEEVEEQDVCEVDRQENNSGG